MNKRMKVFETEISGLYVIEPKVFRDDRGYFFESFSRKTFEEMTGVQVDFVQDNESLSSYGVIRGLHFQKPPHEQAKLVRVVSGKVIDVAVDLREGSPTYGQWHAEELSSENGRQMYIPKGFAHGFGVLSEKAVFQYKCDDYYAPECEDGIVWDDPELAIDWKIPADDVILSDKDRKYPGLKERK